jgi:hypothetical protein
MLSPQPLRILEALLTIGQAGGCLAVPGLSGGSAGQHRYVAGRPWAAWPRAKADLGSPVTVHILRHSFACPPRGRVGSPVAANGYFPIGPTAQEAGLARGPGGPPIIGIIGGAVSGSETADTSLLESGRARR